MKLLKWRLKIIMMEPTLTEGQLNTISYQKDGGVPEERVVVPSFVPTQTIKAIDVGGMNDVDVAEMVALASGYKEYYAALMNTAFNFETWVEHTHNKTVVPKWRSFKLANILKVIR